MSSIIQLLPDHVANQIAAGEVVQRPASVVKELLENAVDAGATDIKLIIKDAGKSLVQVIDNGKGMNVTDARLCFERHATSKIRLAEDLFLLTTKGFRGEALAAIAAIAHVELKTKQENDELGTKITIEGSKFVSQEIAVLPKGTSFSIKNLFFNIPARRNFLKSDTIEFKHIVDEFQRVALAHPSIHFTFYHNGEEMFNLPISNLRQRIVNLFSGKTNEKLVPVQEDTEIVKVKGFIGKPEFARKNRNEQFFFVNDRFIKSGYLHHAIVSAYEGILKEGGQPSYFLYLNVPPSTIDINIHPTKTEIKFDNEQALYAIIRATIKHSLGQFNVSDVLDFNRDPNLDPPLSYKDLSIPLPSVQTDISYNPFAVDKLNNHYSNSKKSGISTHNDGIYTGLKQDTDVFLSSFDFSFENDEVTGSLFNDEEVEQKDLSPFQVQKKYIVTPIKSGMVVLDQKRAHQRVLYEQFLTNMTVRQASSQQLLFPLDLFLSAKDLVFFRELKLSLINTGFVFEETNTGRVVISGIPVHITESEASTLIEQLLNDLQDGIPESSFSQNDTIAKSMAKSLAIKTGVSLSIEEQENLVNALFACKEPTTSPFHKKTFITMLAEDIDKKFNL